MKRTLMVALILFSAACSKESTTSSEQNNSEPTPVPAAEAEPDTAVPLVAASEPPRVDPSTDLPPELRAHFKDLERSGPVVGEVERLATLRNGYLKLLHEVVVANGYAYVEDASGMIYRVPVAGGEFEVVYDSDLGAGVHAGALSSVADVAYFTVDPYEGEGELKKVTEDGLVAVARTDDLLEMAGNEDYLFATYYKRNDVDLLGEKGFARFAKSRRPGSPVVAGDSLYWTNYKPGGVNRARLGGKGKAKRLAKDKGIIGLAVVGDSVFYGTESDGGIHKVSTSGGASKRIADGFNNHDFFVADDAGIYFWTWGRPGAVLRLDAKTHKIETMVSGVDAPRGLDVVDGWLYLVEGPDLFRVKTDSRMPWPLEAEK